MLAVGSEGNHVGSLGKQAPHQSLSLSLPYAEYSEEKAAQGEASSFLPHYTLTVRIRDRG